MAGYISIRVDEKTEQRVSALQQKLEREDTLGRRITVSDTIRYALRQAARDCEAVK